MAGFSKLPTLFLLYLFGSVFSPVKSQQGIKGTKKYIHRSNPVKCRVNHPTNYFIITNSYCLVKPIKINRKAQIFSLKL